MRGRKWGKKQVLVVIFYDEEIEEFAKIRELSTKDSWTKGEYSLSAAAKKIISMGLRQVPAQEFSDMKGKGKSIRK